MSATPGSTAWKLAFQISPILLEGGLAEGFPFKVMPILLLTEAVNFPLGVLGSGGNISLDNFFANWRPVPGATLLEQEIAKYPFATQQVAANAVIMQPQQISMLMDCPAKGPLSYIIKLGIMEAMRWALYQHNARGGTYIVATPGHLYTDCLMRSFKDVSTSYAKQVQTTWQMDFERPLITMEEAQRSMNGLYSLLDKQVPIAGQPANSGTAIAGATSGQIGAPTLSSGMTAGTTGMTTPSWSMGPTGIGPGVGGLPGEGFGFPYGGT